MRPKKHTTTGLGDLFRARLEQIINMKHELVQLGDNCFKSQPRTRRLSLQLTLLRVVDEGHVGAYLHA